jgi:hypothetical protein
VDLAQATRNMKIDTREDVVPHGCRKVTREFKDTTCECLSGGAAYGCLPSSVMWQVHHI